MTLKELFLKYEFDTVVPDLLTVDEPVKDNLYAFKETRHTSMGPGACCEGCRCVAGRDFACRHTGGWLKRGSARAGRVADLRSGTYRRVFRSQLNKACEGALGVEGG